MPIQWPFIIVVMLSYLLTIAPSASAGCVWVLWETMSRKRDGIGMFLYWYMAPKRTYPTEEICWGIANESNASEDRMTTKNPGRSAKSEYDCWPDTVDPRGPKGGK